MDKIDRLKKIGNLSGYLTKKDGFLELIERFISYVDSNDIDIYNEFSLQHELGIFLRFGLSDYKIEFERNIRYFGIEYNELEKSKHEIDISVYKKDAKTTNERYAIELKFPSYKLDNNGNKVYNGGNNLELKHCEDDILFINHLKANNFKNAWSLVVVDEVASQIYAFPRQKNKLDSNSIYNRFRAYSFDEINSSVEKNPIDNRNGILWKPWSKNKISRKYYIIEAKSKNI